MHSNFNSLQKPSQLDVGAKVSGSIFEGQYVILGIVCSNFLSTFYLVGKYQFCAFNKSTDNSHVD